MQDMSERLSGYATKQEIVKNEVRSILQKTLQGTTIATKASIYESQKNTEFTRYPAGGADAKLYDLRRRYPDALWAKIQAQMAERLAVKVAAIGWARKSWLALANACGLSIDAGSAAGAEVKGHNAAENVKATEDISTDNYVLTVQNDSPLMRWTGGAQAFFGAIAGRTNFFKQNLAHGVFNDLKQVAKKYPGIDVQAD